MRTPPRRRTVPLSARHLNTIPDSGPTPEEFAEATEPTAANSLARAAEEYRRASREAAWRAVARGFSALRGLERGGLLLVWLDLDCMSIEALAIRLGYTPAALRQMKCRTLKLHPPCGTIGGRCIGVGECGHVYGQSVHKKFVIEIAKTIASEVRDEHDEA